MAENVEEIEAKLAAYVDGELTPAERVEIETYLQSNPSHRALLQDLVQHRNLLRSLPREKAPGDCTEGFQGQLEREVLLGGDELTRARRRWQIRYSPQLLSAAAIILVALALGVIVYTVLPPHQSHPPISQLSTEPSKSAEPATSESSTGTLADARAFRLADEPVAKKGAVDANWNLSKEAVVGQKADNTYYANFKEKAAREGIAAGDMMVITVTADDVKSANDAVVNYLALNKINYTEQAEGVLKDGLEAMAFGGRLAGGITTAGGAGGGGAPFGGGSAGRGGFGGAGVAAGASQRPALDANEDQVAKREETLLRSRVATSGPEMKQELKAVTAQIEEKNIADEKLAQIVQPQPENLAKAARPAPTRESTVAPTTQPSAVVLNGEARGVNDAIRFKGGYAGDRSGAEVVQLQQQMPGLQFTDTDSAACVILARDMNGQQVRELARSLSQPERNLYATVQLDRADTYRRTTLATMGRVNQSDPKDQFFEQQRKLDEAEVLLADKYVAAKSLPANAPAAISPTTRPAAELTLNIKASDAGLTRQSETGIVSGTVAANTSPNDFAFDAVQQPLLPAQQQATLSAPAATQPVVGKRLDLFTCVIVVQNNPSARAGGPATQPIAGKPAATAPSAAPTEATKEAK